MRDRTTVFAPGKLFVIGEYAVLEGGRALVAALDAGISCTVEAGGADSWLAAPDIEVDGALDQVAGESRGALLLANAVSAGCREFGITHPVRVDVRGTHFGIRRKCGLGGSAASVTAILGSLAAASGADVEASEVRARVFPIALRIHREHQQGRGSGADIAASLCGGWVDYSIGEGGPRFAAAAVPADLRITAVWSGMPRDTGAALAAFARVAETSLNDSQRRRMLLGRLHLVLDRFWVALDRGDREGMLRGIRDYGEVLDDLAMPSEDAGARRISELVAAAGAAGVAAKGSGAVGGDCAIAVGFDDERLRMAEDSWRILSAVPLSVGVDSQGLREEHVARLEH
jgi:phosphomevalonate kinase